MTEKTVSVSELKAHLSGDRQRIWRRLFTERVPQAPDGPYGGLVG